MSDLPPGPDDSYDYGSYLDWDLLDFSLQTNGPSAYVGLPVLNPVDESFLNPGAGTSSYIDPTLLSPDRWGMYDASVADTLSFQDDATPSTGSLSPLENSSYYARSHAGSETSNRHLADHQIAQDRRSRRAGWRSLVTPEEKRKRKTDVDRQSARRRKEKTDKEAERIRGLSRTLQHLLMWRDSLDEAKTHLSSRSALMGLVPSTAAGKVKDIFSILPDMVSYCEYGTEVATAAMTTLTTPPPVALFEISEDELEARRLEERKKANAVRREALGRPLTAVGSGPEADAERKERRRVGNAEWARRDRVAQQEAREETQRRERSLQERIDESAPWSEEIKKMLAAFAKGDTVVAHVGTQRISLFAARGSEEGF